MEKINICLMAGKQAGVIGLLTILTKSHKILSVVAYDELVKMVCEQYNIKIFDSIKDKGFLEYLKKSDLLVSVHGREIITKELLDLPRIGCINVHPCLYKYKGKDPIKRLLEDGENKASVGVHYMNETVDKGELIIEEFVNVKDLKDVVSIYNRLYPYYSIVLIKALEYINTNLLSGKCPRPSNKV
jgi:methionyl-tRNA formyltransferase